MKLTMTEAIGVLADIRENMRVKSMKATNVYYRPYTVNGKKVVTEEKEKEAINDYKEISNCAKDIITLRKAIDKKNLELGILYIKTELQEKRKLQNQLEGIKRQAMGSYGAVHVTDGVGVVENKLVGEDYLLEAIDELNAEIRNLQRQLDDKNNTNEIEVELLTVEA